MSNCSCFLVSALRASISSDVGFLCIISSLSFADILNKMLLSKPTNLGRLMGRELLQLCLVCWKGERILHLAQKANIRHADAGFSFFSKSSFASVLSLRWQLEHAVAPGFSPSLSFWSQVAGQKGQTFFFFFLNPQCCLLMCSQSAVSLWAPRDVFFILFFYTQLFFFLGLSKDQGR